MPTIDLKAKASQHQSKGYTSSIDALPIIIW